ncbi:MAG: FAD-binding oxidoreductase [Lentisphaerae bacterium]|nr:FAD-binding oxidoreductase [Lentisphaerota bacterium]
MIEAFQPEHADCLRDESRRTGRADSIAFPRAEPEVLEALADAGARSMPVTTQGARTGIAGGAVPEGGLILNLSRMTRIRPAGDGELRVEPGATLDAVRAAVPPGWMFTPDPTETTASLGGMISCNASGALSYRYGPTRNHILGLRVATLSGDILDLRRGRDRADGLRFTLGAISGELPVLPRPAVKNAAGYFVDPDMDLVDLFIGAEGTLGVVTEATLRLRPAPATVWGLMVFLPDTASAVACVHALREGQRSDAPAENSAQLAALEYFDARCLAFLRRHGDELASNNISVPAMPDGTACIYAEWHAPGEAEAEAAVMAAAERLPEFGSDPDTAILADQPAELEKLKRFRHAAPERVNAAIDERRRTHPDLTKLGTDMSVPDARLADVLSLYETDLAASGLEFLIFGHIGANHLHVNILPRDPGERTAGKALYEKWADRVIAWGGSISAEHGIGKIKRDLFRRMAGDAALDRMHALKKLFDPHGRLNPGTLLEPFP